ncbi:MAG: hypothetical protein AB7G21_04695 [Dehalococcoidia bacterium]
MSKFRNRIRDLGRAPAGFGFAALTRASAARHMLVVAEVEDAAGATAAAEAGVDAVILRGSASALEGLSLPNNTLAGIWLEDATGAEVEAAQQAGADFFLFDDGRANASALVPTEIGRVLLLGPDQETERLRSVSAIDLDAVVVTGEVGATTVRDQLALRRVASLTGAHLLVAADAVPDTATLEAWRDAGAPAVLVSGSAADLRAAVQAAEAVPAPKRRDERRPMPIIGAPRASAHDHEDEDDDL